MPILIENSVLVLTRLLLFFGCRKLLIRNLYSDLRHISSTSTQFPPTPTTATGAEAEDSEYIRLDSLPTPATQNRDNIKTLTRRSTLHSTISRTVFACCFSECCMLFLLLMAQGMEVFETRTRLMNWKFSISFLLLTVLVLTPLFMSLVISLSSSSSTGGSQAPRTRICSPRLFLTFLPLFIYLYILSLIPLPPGLAPGNSNSNNNHGVDLFTATLARLVVLGTIILGLLSGVGAVAGLEEHIPGLFNRSKGDPSARDVELAEQALEQVREDLRRKREVRRASASDQSPTTSGSWISRVVPKFTGGDDLTLEIKGMEALEHQMSQSLEDLRRRYERVKFATTFRGRVIRIFGKIFAAYCFVRIISSIINVVVPRALLAMAKTDKPTPPTNYPDLLTKLIGDLLSLTSTNVDIEEVGSIMRQISLGLVGVIILNSLRVVLRGVTSALRVTSRSLSASLMLLILAQLMGIYLLSTIVQLRSSFPPPTPPPARTPGEIPDPGEEAVAEAVTRNLFSMIPEFQVFGKLFDGSFLVAAGISGFYRWFKERISGSSDDVW
ncbi:hypothetical protein E1B28_013729 [Marasmius oreades]|uniref:G protein-coupled receptor 89 n=1 Tax=Marasmius oreades TaxID=181124 RepID=A0A9P7RQZ8_9AGAR|nr:uncharacterized protein E1B28_013729 [Marasmius oreades]KAG7087788.1 hypothetical protein E1B28_013729 [Marasmius oreades]